MSMMANLNRRRFLQGAGVAVALPWLESFSVFAAEGKANLPPVRYLNMYLGNGVDGGWSAEMTEDGMKLGPVLEPLQPFTEDVTFVNKLKTTGLNHHGCAHYLSGYEGRGRGMVDLSKSKHRPKAGAPLSIDQVFADAFASTTELPSLVVGCEETKGDGGESNISWRVGAPVPKEIHPTAAFDSLFNGPQQRRRDQSVLDFVREDLKSLTDNVSQLDRQRLDEFTTSVRELERRIANAGKLKQDGFQPILAEPDLERPLGFPPLPDYMRLMADIVLLAFQMNKTRVATLMLNNELSRLDYGFLPGVQGTLHPISHGEGSKGAHEKTTRFHVELLAEVLKKFKAYTEGDRTLLDSSVIHFGSIMKTGSHSQNDIPCVLAGKAGGALTPGQVIEAEGFFLGNVNLSLAQQLGLDMKRFGEMERTISL